MKLAKRLVRVLGLVACLHASLGAAHLIEDNRAKLVMREPSHLTLTLYIRYSEVLYQALAPGRTYTVFLMSCAAMKPDEFKRLVLHAQAHLESETRAVVNGVTTVPILGWQWPDPAQVQATIKQQVIEAMVGGGEPTHDAPIEIHADILSHKEIKDASLRFPPEFKSVLFVWYRPEQIRVAPKQFSKFVKF